MNGTLNQSPKDAVTNLINLKTIAPNQSSAASITTKRQVSTIPAKPAKNKPQVNVVLHELKGLLQTSFSSSSSSTSFSDPKPKHEEQHRVGINFAGTIYRVPGLFTFVDKKIIQEWARSWQQGLFVSTDIRTVRSIHRNQPTLSLSMKGLCRWLLHKVHSETPPLLHNSLKRGRVVDGQQMVLKKPKYVKKTKIIKQQNHQQQQEQEQEQQKQTAHNKQHTTACMPSL